MTLEELAERADLTPDYLGKLEHGHYSPSADTMLAIAKALGVEPGLLFPSSGPRGAAKRRALDELLAAAAPLGDRDLAVLLIVARALRKPT